MTAFFQIWSLASSVIWAWSHHGSQSAGQSISLFRVPAIATVARLGSAGGSPSSGTVWVGRLTTWVVVESPATRPAASLTTARYSSGVSSGMSDTSWNTRNGALSSVPRGCHARGTDLTPHERRLREGARRDVGARPRCGRSAPPSASTVSTVGAAPVVEIGLLAFHTLRDSGGTVTVTDPSALALTAWSVP